MIKDAISTGQALAKGSRAQNVVFSGLLASTIAFRRGSTVGNIIACYLLVVLLYALAANFNNLSDRQTDILNNRKDNPYIKNAPSHTTFMTFVLLSLLGICGLQLMLRQPYSAVIALIYLAFAYAYSDSVLNIKSRGLWGTLLLCVCYGTLPAVLGYLQGSVINDVKIVELGVFTCVSIAPLILAKDYKDYKGDRLTNKQTPLVLMGHRKVFQLSSVLSVVIAIVYISLAFRRHYSPLAVMLATAYCLLTQLIHRKRGEIHGLYRFALILTLLAMPLSVFVMM